MPNEDIEDVVDVPEITPVLDDQGNDTTDWKTLAEERQALALKNLGIAKRYKTKAEKAKDTVVAPPVDKKESKPDENNLLQKAFLRSAGIIETDEVEEALKTAKKWGMEVDALVDDEDWQGKLDKLRTNKANTLATSKIKGGSGTSQAKNTPEYWIAKGTPPSPTDVPDRKIRASIARAMMANVKSSKTFYND